MLCCRKGWGRLQLPLNYFLFLWFLSHRLRALINTFPPPKKNKINNQDRTVFSIQLWGFFSIVFFVFNGSNADILGNLCLQACDMSFWLVIFSWPSVGGMRAVTNRRPTARYVRVLRWCVPHLAASMLQT